MSEIAKFLIKNNLINETYTDYLVRQSKNGLSRIEKDFLRSVLLKDSDELKKLKVLIRIIFMKYSYDYPIITFLLRIFLIKKFTIILIMHLAITIISIRLIFIV